MKASEFKKLIKEAVKEVIQEELRDILLEAVKSPKQIVRESYTPSPTHIPTPSPSYIEPTMSAREKYMGILGETAMSFNTNDLAASRPFQPHGDPINGSLGSGEVGMDQIMSLLKK
jgi:hypothetical protein